MTITYVGAGAAATGNNASVTPGAVSGVAAGDLVLIEATIRNSGTGTVNVPTGWTTITASENMTILGRIWQAGDALPLVTFTGGVANADTIARAMAFRGVTAYLPDIGGVQAQLNGSAQNIAFPALTAGDRTAAVLFVWKQDDATSLATPATWTAVGTTSTTTGDDALQAAYYQVLTTGATIPLGSVVVTGGASAISRAIGLVLKPAAAITAVEQDVWPPRVLVSVTGLTLTDDVSIYRSVAGERTLIRAGQGIIVTDPSFVRVDAELPFGVPVTYVAVVNGAAEYIAAPLTIDLPGGKVALTDAVTGASAEAVILSWDEKTYDRNSSVFKVGARNVVISGDFGMFEASIELYFEATSAVDNFHDLVRTATEGVIQIRVPDPTYAGVDCYVAVTGAAQRRFSKDGSDPRRTWVVQVAEVEGWADALEASGFTLQDIADYYGASGTLADIEADYPTLLDLAQGDFS